MALSIGFRIFSFLPSCYSRYGALNFYPGGTFTHCSCQPSLDAHLPGSIPAGDMVRRGESAACAERSRNATAQPLPGANTFRTHVPDGICREDSVKKGINED